MYVKAFRIWHSEGTRKTLSIIASGKAAQENVSETAHHKEPEKDRRLKAL